MKRHRSGFFTKSIGYLAAAGSLLTVMAGTISAQGPPPSPGSLDVDNARVRMEEQTQREAALRDNGTMNAKRAEPVNKARVEAAVEQLKQDFRRIQIVRNEMVRNLLANKPLDYNLISEQTEEINKRANRLKTYLIALKAEDKEKDPKTQAEFSKGEIKGALVKLCNLIAGFIDNPVLKTPGTTDAEQSVKASDDLQSIIELSGTIRKSAESLSKTPK